jgi:haloalkane dehalogenase
VYQPTESLYPFASHWLNISGLRMHYLDEGPRVAPVVLMVHGNPTWSFLKRNQVVAQRVR